MCVSKTRQGRQSPVPHTEEQRSQSGMSTGRKRFLERRAVRWNGDLGVGSDLRDPPVVSWREDSAGPAHATCSDRAGPFTISSDTQQSERFPCAQRVPARDTVTKLARGSFWRPKRSGGPRTWRAEFPSARPRSRATAKAPLQLTGPSRRRCHDSQK